MVGRGVHFALSQNEEKRLLKARNDDDRMEVVEELEEAWKEGSYQETDKAWDAIHRCLTDGKLHYQGGVYPFNRFILGGQQLYEGNDYIMTFITRNEVNDIAAALPLIKKEWFRERYFKLDTEDYDPEFSEEDFEYTWGWFELLQDFFHRTARNNQSVVFTVDL